MKPHALKTVLLHDLPRAARDEVRAHDLTVRPDTNLVKRQAVLLLRLLQLLQIWYGALDQVNRAAALFRFGLLGLNNKCAVLRSRVSDVVPLYPN